jgi:hypothetical protein
MRFDDLSDTAWRVFTGALMWCNRHGTDGALPTRYLKTLHPDGVQPAANEELEHHQLWSRTETGYKLAEWGGKLGQSTADEVEAYKASNRERQRKFRDRERAKKAAHLPRDVTRYVTDDVTGDVGKDRLGKDRPGQAEVLTAVPDEKPVNAVATWPVVQIPVAPDTRCVVCDAQLPAGSTADYCEASDDAQHAEYERLHVAI